MTIKTFAIVVTAIFAIIALFVTSIMLFGKIGIVVAIAVLVILLASYLYSSERLKDIEREEEKHEDKVKSDYSYIKRTMQGRRGYY